MSREPYSFENCMFFAKHEFKRAFWNFERLQFRYGFQAIQDALRNIRNGIFRRGQ